MSKEIKTTYPDYANCIANLPNSVLKHWGLPTVGETLSAADVYLKKDYKNVVVFLLDGLGKAVIEESLDPAGPLRSHLVCGYSSVFIPTTVAATTSAMTGLQPCEHSWLGWDCYYPQIDKNVTVYFNRIQGTKELAADSHVAHKYTPYVDVVSMINDAGGEAYYSTPYEDPFPNTLKRICARVKDLCKQPGKKYIYAYWSQPDTALHMCGRGSAKAIKDIKKIEKYIAGLADDLKDTLLIVTADHGHINTDFVLLDDYPELVDCLVRWPSFEARTLNLFVKEDKREFFVSRFNEIFGKKFILLTKQEVLDKKLMGTGNEHECFRDMLGDYLAVATSDLSIVFTAERPLSLHSGLTEDEMIIPFIVFEK